MDKIHHSCRQFVVAAPAGSTVEAAVVAMAEFVSLLKINFQRKFMELIKFLKESLKFWKTKFSNFLKRAKFTEKIDNFLEIC